MCTNLTCKVNYATVYLYITKTSPICQQYWSLMKIFSNIIDCAKFVDVSGCLKPSGVQASQLFFERKAESMGMWLLYSLFHISVNPNLTRKCCHQQSCFPFVVFLQNCVLNFHKHGMQGKSLHTQQVTAEVADGSKIFHLLGSHG